MVAGMGLTLSCMKIKNDPGGSLDRIACDFVRNAEPRGSAFLFQEKEPGSFVFPNFIPIRHRVDSFVTWIPGKVVDGDLLAPLEGRSAPVKMIGLPGLFAGSGKGHDA